MQARLAEAIAHWRAKAAVAAREWEVRNAALAAERAAAARHHRALKAALERFRAQQAERLRELSVRRCSGIGSEQACSTCQISSQIHSQAPAQFTQRAVRELCQVLALMQMRFLIKASRV